MFSQLGLGWISGNDFADIDVCRVSDRSINRNIILSKLFEVIVMVVFDLVADASPGATCGMGNFMLGMWTASGPSQVCTHVQMRVVRCNNDRKV